MYTCRLKARLEFSLRHFSLREVRGVIQMVLGRVEDSILVVIIVATFPSSEVYSEKYYQLARSIFWCEVQRHVESLKHADRHGF